jgi:hypothetical protein
LGVAITPPSEWAAGWVKPKTLDKRLYLEARDDYEKWVMLPEQAPLRARARRWLKGFDLGCYCPAGFACHGDVLLQIANGPEEGPKVKGRRRMRRSPAR